MFDTKRIYNSTTIHRGQDTIKVDVKEFKAPTDDSIRILSEMEEKMRNRVLAIVPVEDNVLKGSVIYYSDQMISNRILVHAKFTLNEKEYHVETAIDRWDIKSEILQSPSFANHHQIIVRKLIMEFALQIAQEVLGQSKEFVAEFLKIKY